MSNKPMQRVAYLFVVLFGFLATAQARSENQEVNKTFSVKSGGTLTIESTQGRLEVETWGKDQVEVKVKMTARSAKRLDDFKLDFEQKGNDVFIEGDGGWNSRVSVKFLVKVPKKYNLDLQTGGGSIEVSDISGEVKVKTSGGSINIGDVTGGNVNANTSGGSIKVGNVDGNLAVDTSGGSIRLGKITGRSLIDTSGGSITLEQGGGDVKAETSGGSIKIGPVNGKVDVDTSGGSIQIGMAENDVLAKTSGGSIKVEGSKGSVEVDTSGGSIFVGSSGGSVKAETGGGSIKILQAKGFIEAETAGGKIEAEMILDDKNADTHVDLKTDGGSITVYLPKKLAATISASLRITRSARRDYRIYSDFPLTVKGEDSNRITAKGNINGGGDKVSLNTTNGDIHIKMLDD